MYFQMLSSTVVTDALRINQPLTEKGAKYGKGK